LDGDKKVPYIYLFDGAGGKSREWIVSRLAELLNIDIGSGGWNDSK